MIQDIAPHHFDNAYHSYAPCEEDFAIYCQPHQVLLKRQEDRIIFPTFRDLKKRNDDILENATYLFQIDEFRFFLVKHVTRNHYPASRWKTPKSSVWQNHNTWLLPESLLTSFISGMKAGNSAAAAVPRSATMRKNV